MLLLLIKVFNEERQKAIINLILVGFLWNLSNQYTFGKHLLASTKKEKSWKIEVVFYIL